jgi:hypothetical protein
MIGPKQIFSFQHSKVLICFRERNKSKLTILLVELLNLEHIFAWLNDIKVELIPPSQSSKLWPWYVGQRVEVQAAYGSNECQQGGQDNGSLYNLKKSHGSGWSEMPV